MSDVISFTNTTDFASLLKAQGITFDAKDGDTLTLDGNLNLVLTADGQTITATYAGTDAFDVALADVYGLVGATNPYHVSDADLASLDFSGLDFTTFTADVSSFVTGYLFG